MLPVQLVQSVSDGARAEFLEDIARRRLAFSASWEIYSTVDATASTDIGLTPVRRHASDREAVSWSRVGGAAVLIEQRGTELRLTGAANDTGTLTAALDRIAEAVRALLPKDLVTAQVWSSGRSQERPVPTYAWTEISMNYPARVREQLDSVMTAPHPPASSGLIVWHGPPGTGKTAATRALLRRWSGSCDLAVILDGASFLKGHFDFDQFMDARDGLLRRRPTLLVLEDLDEILLDHGRTRVDSGLAKLLSLTDGLVTDLGLVVVATTNSEIAALDAALKRPGRCLGVVEFRRFLPDEAADWLGCGPATTAEATLAELYAERESRPRSLYEATTVDLGGYL